MLGPARLSVACGALALAAASCGGGRSSSDPDPIGSPSGGADGSVELSLSSPTALSTSRAIEPDALEATVVAGRLPVEVIDAGNGVRTVQLRAPAVEALPVAITWFERVGETPLPLLSQSLEIGPADAGRTLEIDPDRFDAAPFDRDGDGVTNLDERESGDDPLRAPDAGPLPVTDDERNDETPLASPPGADAALDVVVLPMMPAAGRPAIDGLYDDPIWPRNVSSRNLDGRLLFVNRLIEDRTPSTVDEPQGYQWLAMHDFTHLYLYVVFERGNRRTAEVNPHRDSASFHDDDVLSLYFDGDHGRASALDGADDRRLVIPLIRPEPLAGQPRAFSPDPASAALAASLEFNACVCEDEVESAWEVRIPTAELGIAFDRPFGFEVRIDQDVDGGAGESSWAWASPVPGERDAGFEHGSPAFYGTVMLSSNR